MLCIAWRVRMLIFWLPMKSLPCCRREPVDFHSRTYSATVSRLRRTLDLILFPFGGALSDARSITAHSNTFSFLADCYFLRAMRVDRRERDACVSGLRE